MNSYNVSPIPFGVFTLEEILGRESIQEVIATIKDSDGTVTEKVEAFLTYWQFADCLAQFIHEGFVDLTDKDANASAIALHLADKIVSENFVEISQQLSMEQRFSLVQLFVNLEAFQKTLFADKETEYETN
jgi:hypothetical protein